MKTIRGQMVALVTYHNYDIATRKRYEYNILDIEIKQPTLTLLTHQIPYHPHESTTQSHPSTPSERPSCLDQIQAQIYQLELKI